MLLASAVGCYAGTSFDGGESGAASSGSDGGTESGPPESGSGDPSDDPAELACQGGIDVGLTPMRRLTRAQYQNAIRDLLGVQVNADEMFDADEKVGPFHGNSIIPVTERSVQQYMTAAEEIAVLAVADLEQIAPCAAEDGRTCAAQFVASFGRRAFRRPLAQEEQDALLDAYDVGAAQTEAGFAGGMALVLEAILQSPDFVYIIETGQPAEASVQENVVALTGYEVATRLAFFLWNSTPDDELLDAAEMLDDRDVVQEQTRRMLEDPRARDTIGLFHAQWLGLTALGDAYKDATLFPGFDDATKAAMVAETVRFAQHVFFEDDARLQTLLTAPYTFIEPALAGIYGVELAADHQPETPVPLDPSQRAGLLTQSGFLAVNAHHNQTSPVHRGLAIRRHVLCQELKPPPPGVNDEIPEPDPNSTTRERFEEHTSNPTCAGCHKLIDGVGLGLEHYDPVGAWRQMDGISAVDASGNLLSAGEGVEGEFYGGVELAHKLAQSDIVRECVARQWFRFALGRSVSDHDECYREPMFEAFADSDYDLTELVVSLATSPAFRYLRTTL